MVESAYLAELQIHGGASIALQRFRHAPVPRRESVPVPRGDGELDFSRFYSGAVVELAGFVRGDTVGGAIETLDVLRAALALGGGGLELRFRRAGRDFDELCTVRQNGAIDAPLEGLSRVIGFAVDFIAADPRIYSSTLRTGAYDPTDGVSGGLSFPLNFPLVFAATSGAALDVTNAGTRSTPPTYTIAGPARNPIVDNETTGASLYTTGVDLAAGEELTIDVARRRVVLGGTSRPDLIAGAPSVWGDLAPGPNRLRMRGDGFSAGLTELGVAFRDARI